MALCSLGAVSYVLAIWEGAQPASEAEAFAEYERLVNLYRGDRDGSVDDEPTPAIRRFVDALLERWPDLGASGGDDSPWSDAPMIDNAHGPFLSLGIGTARVDDAVPYVSELARSHDLVCFDPSSQTRIDTTSAVTTANGFTPVSYDDGTTWRRWQPGAPMRPLDPALAHELMRDLVRSSVLRLDETLGESVARHAPNGETSIDEAREMLRARGFISVMDTVSLTKRPYPEEIEHRPGRTITRVTPKGRTFAQRGPSNRRAATKRA